MMNVIKKLAVAGAIGCAAMSAAASAAPIFQDNFNGYSGARDDRQPQTGLPLEAFGSLPLWDAQGFNAVHAVDRANGTGARDWAIMLYGGTGRGDTNVITLKNAVAANAAGVTYTVSFQAAAAAYSNNGEGNAAGDVLNFRVNDGAGALIASYDYAPALWATVIATGSNPFAAGAFSFTGTGSGNVFLSVRAVAAAGRFGGAVDNVSVSQAVPEPATWALLLLGFGGMGHAMRRRTKVSARIRFA